MYLLSLLLALSSFWSPEHDAGDRELMRRIQMREVDALDKIYDRYASFLFSLIMAIVHKQPEAEDLLQEVFIQVWECADSYDPERGSAYAWLVTLTRNKAIDRTRSKGYKNQIREAINIEDAFGDPPADDRNPLENSVLADRAALVKKALEQIPVEQRRVIEIAYFTGLSQSEIANSLDLPLGTVKSRMRQGMIKLKDLLVTYFS